MADQKLTSRPSASDIDDLDVIHIVDVSDLTDDPTGTSKKGVWSLFKSTLQTFFDTIYQVVGNYVTTDTVQQINADKGYNRSSVQIDTLGDLSLVNRRFVIENAIVGGSNFVTKTTNELTGLTGNKKWDGDFEYNKTSSEIDTLGDLSLLNKRYLNDREATSADPTVVSAIWTGTGLEFFVTADVYYIDNVKFSATAANVTLETADGSLDRLDFLGAFANGTVGKVTGTPASSALVVAPDFDPTDFFPIKLVLVKAAETTPSDPETGDPATTNLIFDENTGSPTEWDLTLTGGDLAVTTNDPFSGAESIEATDVESTDVMTFISDTTLHTDDIDAISWWTKLKADMSGQYIQIKLYKGTKKIGSTTQFNTGSNGFDSSNLNYQKITVNRDNFTRLKSAEYDTIKINYYTFTNFDGWFFDLFELHSGSSPLPPIDQTIFAKDVLTNTENFDGNLSSTDDTVQKALDTLDDLEVTNVKVSANDTTPGVLNGKLVAGTNITLVEGNDGGDETLTINSTGGGGSPLTTKGDVFTYDTGDQRLAVGSNGQILSSDSAEATGLKWISAGVGDMILASVQIVTGLKTFDALKLGMRNVADTFTSLFTNVNTAARTYTLPNDSGDIPLKKGVESSDNSFIVVCSNFETDLETKVLSAYFDLPYDFTFTEVIGTVITAPTGSSIIADVNIDGTTIMTTNKVEIEVTEDSSLDATTQPTITDAAHSKGQRVSIDIDQVGSTITGTDLEIELIGYQT